MLTQHAPAWSGEPLNLTYPQSLLLGLVQGLAEFLPVSSSGHLAIVQHWLGLDPDSQPILLFDVASHVATLLAVLLFFAGSVRDFLAKLVFDFRRMPAGLRGNAFRIALLAITACVPTGIIGLAFKHELEAAFAKPRWIGVSLIGTGFLLAMTGLVRPGRRGWRAFTWWQAAGVGVAQGLAILPGISRSGATICTALYFGLKRRWAAEFSFLIAAPAILGATAIKLLDIIEMQAASAVSIPWGPILAGSVVAFATGLVALAVLVRVVRLSKLHCFAPYCWAVGGLVLLVMR